MASRSLAPEPMQLVAVGLLLVGFAFKVSAIPFHMWTPDAYEGAPTAVTGFMSTGVKAAGVRRVRPRLPVCHSNRSIRSGAPLVWAIAMATMIGASLAGVAQTSVKRLLAYSSIAHAGYLLVALVSANDVGKGSGALLPAGVCGDESRRVRRGRRPRDLRSIVRPGAATMRACGTSVLALAALMTLFLLSLGGFPPLRRVHRQVVRLQRCRPRG